MDKSHNEAKKYNQSRNADKDNRIMTDRERLIQEKKNKEKKVVELMIRLYCRKNHNSEQKSNYLCEECNELLKYAFLRTDKCPFLETKTFCSHCKVHCYKPVMKVKIKEVMKWAGPRMMLYHPVLSVKHTLGTLKIKYLLKNGRRE